MVHICEGTFMKKSGIILCWMSFLMHPGLRQPQNYKTVAQTTELPQPQKQLILNISFLTYIYFGCNLITSKTFKPNLIAV